MKIFYNGNRHQQGFSLSAGTQWVDKRGNPRLLSPGDVVYPLDGEPSEWLKAALQKSGATYLEAPDGGFEISQV